MFRGDGRPRRPGKPCRLASGGAAALSLRLRPLRRHRCLFRGECWARLRRAPYSAFHWLFKRISGSKTISSPSFKSSGGIDRGTGQQPQRTEVEWQCIRCTTTL